MQPLYFGTSGMTKASWEFSFINVFAVHITHMPILVVNATDLFMFSVSFLTPLFQLLIMREFIYDILRVNRFE